MFSNKKTLLVAGASAGVVTAILFAALLSSTAASAQMMSLTQNNGTNSMMMDRQNHYPRAHDMGMFSVMGMSMAKDVAVTGVSVTGDSEVSVNVRYTGNATSTPGLGVFVMTNHMGMMKEHMMGGMTYGGQQYAMGGFNPMMMMGGNSMMAGNGSVMMNGMQQWNGTMMQNSWVSHSGSNFVKAGWTASGNTIKVKLDGASAYDARDIMVMVCPYLG